MGHAVIARSAPKATTGRDPLAWCARLAPHLTPAQVATFRGCTPADVDAAIASGALVTATRFGRVMVTRESFTRWLRAGLQQSA